MVNKGITPALDIGPVIKPADRYPSLLKTERRRQQKPQERLFSPTTKITLQNAVILSRSKHLTFLLQASSPEERYKKPSMKQEGDGYYQAHKQQRQGLKIWRQ